MRNKTQQREYFHKSRAYIDQIGGSMTLFHTNLSQTMTMMSETEQKLEVMENNVTTIKTNLVGLGAYINSVNGDVNQLMVSLDSFANKACWIKSMKCQKQTNCQPLKNIPGGS